MEISSGDDESTTSELAGYTTSNDITSDMDTEINNNIITTSLPNIENQTTPTSNTSKSNTTLHNKYADNLSLHSSIHNPENWNPKNQFQQTSSSEWEIVTSTKRHRAWIAEQALPEKDTKTNIKYVNSHFHQMQGFIRSKSITYDKLKYICLEFSSLKALNNAANIEINKTHITNVSPIPPSTTKPELTVALRDVPIGTTQEQIQATMSKFGQITKINQRIISKWLYTTVQYETEAAAKSAIEEWSTLLGTDRIRILPLLDQPTILEQRDAHTAKLVNLPYDTTAYELEDMIQSINGKSCYIPRSPVRYTRQRFAIIAFETETDLAKAMNRNFTLRNNKLG